MSTVQPGGNIKDALESIFETRGFARVHPPHFEEYSLYSGNSGLFGQDSTITFMAPDGRLMALKPDATLSVVRGVPDGGPTQKLWYTDSVCRPDKSTGGFAFIRQMGVEIVGNGGLTADIELADMALECMEAMGPMGGFALDMSHQGLVNALMGSLCLPDETVQALLDSLRAKSAHRVAEVLAAAGVRQDDAARVMHLCRPGQPLPLALESIGPLLCRQTEEAIGQLKRICATLGGRAERICLDFSVEGDLDYYNGIAIKGYISGAPRAVLSGGRYDKLMARLGKASGAAGFAIALSLLDELGGPGRAADAVGVYEGEEDFAAALRWQRQMRQAGKAAALVARRDAGEYGCPVTELWRKG